MVHLLDVSRSGFKTPSEAHWLRCRPPINAHIPTYAALSRSACALPLNLIWGFETTSKDYVSSETVFVRSRAIGSCKAQGMIFFRTMQSHSSTSFLRFCRTQSSPFISTNSRILVRRIFNSLSDPGSFCVPKSSLTFPRESPAMGASEDERSTLNKQIEHRTFNVEHRIKVSLRSTI